MKRNLNSILINNFVKSVLWTKRLNQDCLKQNVFLAIRNNRIDLYHGGGKLFSFDSNDFKTHIKYAAVIPKNKKDYLSESDLANYHLISDFNSNYKRIKENCKNYSGVEASGVSYLYHKHSYLSNDNVSVLDIEISFDSLDENSSQDRIDILLYNKSLKTLQFVEAKHYSNKELWSTKTPIVVDQIARYESQIKKRKKKILAEYVEYIKTINLLFNTCLPSPIEIEEKVKLLIFGFDNDQKRGRMKKLICDNRAYNNVKTYPIGDVKKIVTQNFWNS